jgi:hypothetical protein
MADLVDNPLKLRYFRDCKKATFENFEGRRLAMAVLYGRSPREVCYVAIPLQAIQISALKTEAPSQTLL